MTVIVQRGTKMITEEDWEACAKGAHEGSPTIIAGKPRRITFNWDGKHSIRCHPEPVLVHANQRWQPSTRPARRVWSRLTPGERGTMRPDRGPPGAGSGHCASGTVVVDDHISHAKIVTYGVALRRPY